MFIFSPERFEKKSIVSRAVKRDCGDPSRIRHVSSAYWEILCSLPLIIIPPISWFCLMRIAKISEHMMNKYGAIDNVNVIT